MNLSTIFLYGPSGSGKSTLGRLLAGSLGIPFYDLDAEIEKRAGTSILEIFNHEGEAGFRAREWSELEEVLTSMEGVIALGGGALVDPRNRALAESRGRVLLLNAAAQTLLTRLKADSVKRPLLEGDAAARLEALLERRSEHYASFPLRLVTEDLTPEEAAWEAQVRLGAFRVRGMDGQRNDGYHVRVQAGGLDNLGGFMEWCGLKAPFMLVSDENVAPLYASCVTEVIRSCGAAPAMLTLPAGEEHKTAATLVSLWERFVSGGLERGGTVVALGGGVVSDLAGFAAATYMRGVRWAVVPTTLLSMADASLGGKTGADLPQGKNLVGSFHAPACVLADPLLLRTLPLEEVHSGMAEVVKHGIIGDAWLFDLCAVLNGIEGVLKEPDFLEEVVRRAMAVKIRIIEEDPYEQGRRAELNLGHTVGHALEAASGYSLRHGEAVAVGMVAEARLAEHIGLAEKGLSGRIAAALSQLGLPVMVPPGMDMNAVLDAMEHDKKSRGGKARFALPVRVGEVRAGVEIENWRELL